jgi:hypothetical protein
MLLYNVTIGVDKEIESEWLDWIKGYYLPKAMQTNAFSGFKIYKVLTHEDEGSVSYSIQYFSDAIEKIVHYLNTGSKTAMLFSTRCFKKLNSSLEIISQTKTFYFIINWEISFASR